MITKFNLFNDDNWLKWLLPLLALFFLLLSWILEIYMNADRINIYDKIIPSIDFFERYIMALSSMFLSAWLVKYGVEESIKTKEQKKNLLIAYRYVYNRLSIIGRNAFYYIIFKEDHPEYPDPELSIYLGLAGMAMATPAGLVEHNIDNNLRYLAKKLDTMFGEALWSRNTEILSDISERIFRFHCSIRDDSLIMRNELIPKIRLQLDENNDLEKMMIKARWLCAIFSVISLPRIQTNLLLIHR